MTAERNDRARRRVVGKTAQQDAIVGIVQLDIEMAEECAAQQQIDIGEQEPLNVTTSIGLADYHSPESVAQCIERADSLLYRAKQQGRNQVCTATTKTPVTSDEAADSCQKEALIN